MSYEYNVWDVYPIENLLASIEGKQCKNVLKNNKTKSLETINLICFFHFSIVIFSSLLSVFYKNN